MEGVGDDEAVGVGDAVPDVVGETEGVTEGEGVGVGEVEGHTSKVLGLSTSRGSHEDTFMPTRATPPPGIAGAGTVSGRAVRDRTAIPTAIPGTGT